jgi:hypothetical protein
MPHVDEGTLNALLDGALRAEDPDRAAAVEAHLDGCPDCRALLENAADVRDRAAGILGAAAPLARPDFQEVLTRAGLAATPGHAGMPGGAAAGAAGATRGARLRRQARATRTIAWAATIVLALGTGYLIRDRLGPELADPATAARSDTRLERAATDRGEAEHQPTPDVAPERAAVDRDAPVATATARTQAPPPGPDARPEVTATASVEPATTGAAEPSRDAAPATGASAGGAPAPAAPAVVHAAAEARVAEPLGRPTAVAGEPAPRAFQAQRQEAADAAIARRAPEVTGAPGVRTRDLRASAAPPAPAAVALDHVVVVADWRPVTIAEAGAVVDGPIYVLPGAHIVEVTARGRALAAEIRSVQRMEGGVEVRVTQRRAVEAEREIVAAATDEPPPGAGAAGKAAAAEGANVASVLLDGYWLTVSGALPAEALQALAARALPLAGDETRLPR